MLSPKKVKHRKVFTGKLRGTAQRGATIAFGEYALKAVSSGRMTAQQIEAARIAINRKIKRGGKVWIRVFPDKPVTKKPAETRMGKGKGSPEFWVAPVKPGKILYELSGVTEELAVRALTLAGNKLPFATKVISKRSLV
ncbi:50S ribosomal protein L16 [Desulfofustis glycolicus]|jgi:large subunit ribosomal protein L16|uniref:Large ribosomal subunit protein uL16 n=1 Tax=Desulfofustis glycolicus DSM 9705 TaxID=1121409 RepID=A0A1M5Y4I9_9BACT|nr:50S ribosomal protein L16 [Desulfofustis glycolicus]MCB2215051.1 50S ribosomal protein L16 [Desulfobulbaceae bacterium]MEE4315100.1 50S ribosomal protein L16 [Desulfofustis sp.]SHI06957.1 LSU ribosomal protein L16P [Desulfofustis glycolicus DSM 9705]